MPVVCAVLEYPPGLAGKTFNTLNSEAAAAAAVLTSSLTLQLGPASAAEAFPENGWKLLVTQSPSPPPIGKTLLLDWENFLALWKLENRGCKQEF